MEKMSHEPVSLISGGFSEWRVSPAPIEEV
jgi:hypothetical protein